MYSIAWVVGSSPYPQIIDMAKRLAIENALAYLSKAEANRSGTPFRYSTVWVDSLPYPQEIDLPFTNTLAYFRATKGKNVL
jgi:hypothetical protein